MNEVVIGQLRTQLIQDIVQGLVGWIALVCGRQLFLGFKRSRLSSFGLLCQNIKQRN